MSAEREGGKEKATHRIPPEAPAVHTLSHSQPAASGPAQGDHLHLPFAMATSAPLVP